MGDRKPKKPAVRSGKHFGAPPRPAVISTDHLRPVFGLHQLARKYCVTDCDDEQRSALVTKMHRLSQLSWKDIQTAPREGNGFEKIPISQMRPFATPPEMTPDTMLHVFRFHTGLARIVGYRDAHVFHILCVDRNGDLYDHE